MIAGVLTLAIAMTMCLTGTPIMASAASWKDAYKTNGVVTVPSGQTFDTTIDTKTYGKIAWQTTLLNTTVGYIGDVSCTDMCYFNQYGECAYPQEHRGDRHRRLPNKTKRKG